MTDPVTAARERLERLLPDVLRYDPVSMPAFDQRIDALIEAVRAEAGGVSVEALLDAWEAQEHPSIDAAIQAALAARSAGSGSRVERECVCGHGWADHGLTGGCEAEWGTGDGDVFCPCTHTRPTPPPAVDDWYHGDLTDSQIDRALDPNTPPPAVDWTRVDPRQRTGNIGGPAVADHFARPTPPPAVDGTRCAECGGVKDDVFHVPCLVGGPFHYVKTCHPFTPPTPAPDRLRALEAALDHAEKNLGVIALTLTDHPEYPMKAADVDAARSLARFTAQDIRAARDLLADGERSDG
jgi:hypothetical protein